MQPHRLAMLGLVFDLFGAFLLAVEAIKIHNVRALRERFIRPLLRHTRSPRIRVVTDREPAPPDDDAFDESPLWQGKAGGAIFMGLHYVAGALVLWGVDQLVDGKLSKCAVGATIWSADRPLYVSIPLAFMAFWFLGVAGLWLLGEVVHISVTSLLRGLIACVDLIDLHTPDGSVGVLGFFLLATGFALQFLAAYIGAPE